MTSDARIRSVVLLLLLAVALPGRADSWSERVIPLAEQLEATLVQALQLASKAPPQETVIQQRTRDAAAREMENARRLAGAYSNRLQQGATRDSSEPYFNQLRETVEQARVTARDASPGPGISAALARIEALLDEIGKSYAGE